MILNCKKKSSSKGVEVNNVENTAVNSPFVWEGANLYFLLTDRFNNGDAYSQIVSIMEMLLMISILIEPEKQVSFAVLKAEI